MPILLITISNCSFAIEYNCISESEPNGLRPIVLKRKHHTSEEPRCLDEVTIKKSRHKKVLYRNPRGLIKGSFLDWSCTLGILTVNPKRNNPLFRKKDLSLWFHCIFLLNICVSWKQSFWLTSFISDIFWSIFLTTLILAQITNLNIIRFQLLFQFGSIKSLFSFTSSVFKSHLILSNFLRLSIIMIYSHEVFILSQTFICECEEVSKVDKLAPTTARCEAGKVTESITNCQCKI